MRGKCWTVDEIETMRVLIEDGESLVVAREVFPDRKYYSVRSKYLWMQNILAGRDDGDTPRANKQDLAFQDAMLAAIRSGRESAPIGIVKTPDDGEFRPTVFHPEPVVFGSCALADL